MAFDVKINIPKSVEDKMLAVLTDAQDLISDLRQTLRKWNERGDEAERIGRRVLAAIGQPDTKHE